MSLIIIGIAFWIIAELYREWKNKNVKSYKPDPDLDLRPIDHESTDAVATLKFFDTAHN